jgi:hypothetical protein
VTHELITTKGKITVTLTETPTGTVVISHNGKPIMAIRPAREVTAPRPQMRRTAEPQVTDLTGEPSQDYPLMLKRFRKNSYVLRAIAQYYKEKEGFSTPGIENMAQAEKDLELIKFLLPKIIVNNQFIRGARAQIARQLEIKDAGNYRQRIDAVMWVALAEIEVINDELANSEASLGKSGVLLGNSEPKAEFANKSTGFEKRRKAANR